MPDTNFSSLPLSSKALISRRQWLVNSFGLAGLALGLSQCTNSSSTNTSAAIAWAGAELSQPAQRVVLAQSRLLPALSIVDENIALKLVGWSQDLKRLYPSEFDKWSKLFPSLAQIPIVGDGMAQTLSIERILTLAPDLVIFSRSNIGPASNDAHNPDFNLLKRAGIAILIVDFFIHPLQNTVASLRTLATAIGSSQRSEAFINIYQQQLNRITSRLASNKPEQPKVFMHAHAGSAECCFSVGSGVFNDFISTAGGVNLAASILKTPTGQIAKEYIFALQPDIYIASGTNTKNSVSPFKIGPDISATTAQTALRQVIKAANFDSINAVKNQRAFGFWHAFNDSPSHIVLLEVLAKWFHPQLFADLQPEKTLEQLNQNYFIPPLNGTFWTNI